MARLRRRHDYTNGTVFRISTSGTLTNLYSFTGGNDGAILCRAGAGQRRQFLWHDRKRRHVTTNGTVFRISTNGALTSLYSFTGGHDGGIPYAGLVQGSDGNFYGTT